MWSYKKIKCSRCKSTTIIKSGLTREGKQRYKCKDCKARFILRYCYRAYKPEINTKIIKLLKEGMGMRSISRYLRISVTTLLRRMLRLSKNLKSPNFPKGLTYEMDELYTYVGRKENAVWLMYAIERSSRKVVAYRVGRRTKELISQVVNRVLAYSPSKVYTDKLNVYPNLIPKELHKGSVSDEEL